MRNARLWVTEESSFVVLRALAMLGGMLAILLIPHPPEHQPYLGSLAWSFVAYKVGLFLAIWTWPAKLRAVLLASVCLDLAFVSLFVWFGGGIGSHFYLLFYLLVALVAVQFSPGVSLATAGAAGGLYGLATAGEVAGDDWHHLVARIATFFLLAGSLGYLSQRVRLARARAEELNRSLREHQAQLEQAYQALQAAQSRLLQSERLATIGKMSAKVAHEVRNPLSSVSLNAELLEDEISQLPEARRAEAGQLLRAIRSQIDVLTTVTEGYLRFARLPKPQCDLSALGPLIADLAEFVREELRARRVQLVVDVESELPIPRVDAGQIRQALLNLIRNAAEAMPQGGVVTLAARRVGGEGQLGSQAARQPGDSPIGQLGAETGSEASARFSDSRVAKPPSRQAANRVEVTVTDTGLGVAPEDVERVFEPFYTSKQGGTGLGLAISREIAMEHGGTLTCESVSDKGTTFRLTLPISGPEIGR
jgi:signal transduction histidine kinase